MRDGLTTRRLLGLVALGSGLYNAAVCPKRRSLDRCTVVSARSNSLAAGPRKDRPEREKEDRDRRDATRGREHHDVQSGHDGGIHRARR
jgi:hypothetical protein